MKYTIFQAHHIESFFNLLFLKYYNNKLGDKNSIGEMVFYIPQIRLIKNLKKRGKILIIMKGLGPR